MYGRIVTKLRDPAQNSRFEIVETKIVRARLKLADKQGN
jgi:hypothetical protein